MTPPLVLGSGVWSVWIAGPLSMALQLCVCLALAVLVARRSGRPLVFWLFVGLAAAVLPVAGMLGMAAATVIVKAPKASA